MRRLVRAARSRHASRTPVISGRRAIRRGDVWHIVDRRGRGTGETFPDMPTI